MHRRGGSLEKADCHGGGTSIPIPTGGSACKVRTGVWTYHAESSIFQLRDYQQNWPRVKRSQYDGAIRSSSTPIPTMWTFSIRYKICKSGRPENLRRHDDVKRNHPSGSNDNFQWLHQIVGTTIRRPQDVGKYLKNSTERTENRKYQ